MKSKSFRDLISSRHQTDDTFLFTKLKQEKEKKKVVTVPNSLFTSIASHSPNEDQQEIRFNLQVLKLEKAHHIAEKHMKTGNSIKQIMKDIQSQIEEEISNIVGKKKSLNYVKVDSVNRNKGLSSTVGNTPNGNSNNREKKLYQFTLGNMGSNRSSGWKGREGDEVSEFWQSGKKIKNKVIGVK